MSPFRESPPLAHRRPDIVFGLGRGRRPTPQLVRRPPEVTGCHTSLVVLTCTHPEEPRHLGPRRSTNRPACTVVLPGPMEVTVKSKAIAGVDAWLEQAEGVLRDQKERSLSPSSAPQWDSGQVEMAITVAAFTEGIEEVLGALCERPGRWVLIAECGPSRYWQALAFEDGALVTEVISNCWLEGEDRMTPAQEQRLRDLGWSSPDPPRRPNWTRVEPTTSPDVSGVAQQAAATLGQVFGIGVQDTIRVKLFSSPNRGATPASPRYVDPATVDGG